MKKGKIWALAALCASVVLSAGTAAACNKHTHEYGDWHFTTAPTEDAAGVAARDCKDGDHTEEVDVAKLTDTDVWTLSTDPATHDKDGKKTYTSDYGVVEVTIPKGEHTYDGAKWTITQDPDLTEKGKAERKCTANDSGVEEIDIPALSDESVWTAEVKSMPTHVVTGLTVYTSVYGTVDYTVPKLGTHGYGAWEITEVPTMTTGGKAERECLAKDDTQEQVLPALSDDTFWTYSVKEPASHTANGKGEYSSEYGKVEVVIPKGDHTFEGAKWSITVKPTLTAGGKAERNCTADDGGVDTKDIPALSDTTVWTIDEATHKPATDTKPGSATYKSVYGDVSIVLPRLSEPFYNKTYYNFAFNNADTEKNKALKLETAWDTASIAIDGEGKGTGDSYPYRGAVSIVTKDYDTNELEITIDDSKYVGYADLETGIIIMLDSSYVYVLTPFTREVETNKDDQETGTTTKVNVTHSVSDAKASAWTFANADGITSSAMAISYNYAEGKTLNIYVDETDAVHFGVTFTDWYGKAVQANECYNNYAVYVKDSAGELIDSFGYDNVGKVMHILDGLEGVYTAENGKTLTVTGYGEAAILSSDNIPEVFGTYTVVDGKLHLLSSDSFYIITLDAENLTYTAEKPMVTISFNGGDYATVEDASFNLNVPVALPAPESSDPTKIFVGWYTDASCEHAVELNGDGKFVPVAAVTLYAKWGTKVVIRYVLEDGADEVVITCAEGDIIMDKLDVLDFLRIDTAKNRYFIGWYYKVDGKLTSLPTNVALDETNNGLVVYAQWNAIPAYYGTYEGKQMLSGGVLYEASVTINERGKITGVINPSGIEINLAGTVKENGYNAETQVLLWSPDDDAGKTYMMWLNAEEGLLVIPEKLENTEMDSHPFIVSRHGEIGVNQSFNFGGTNKTKLIAYEYDGDKIALMYSDNIYGNVSITDAFGAPLTLDNVMASKTLVVKDGDNKVIVAFGTMVEAFNKVGDVVALDAYYGVYEIQDFIFKFDGLGNISWNDGEDDHSGSYTYVKTDEGFNIFDVYENERKVTIETVKKPTGYGEDDYELVEQEVVTYVNVVYYQLFISADGNSGRFEKPMADISFGNTVDSNEDSDIPTVDSENYNINIGVTLPTPANTESSIFWGWYTDANHEHAVELVDGKYIPTEAATLYAWWRGKVTVTVNYNYDGADENGKVEILPGSTADVTRPEREGYGFKGWYTDAACTDGKEWIPGETEVIENITIYAKWGDLPVYVHTYGALISFDSATLSNYITSQITFKDDGSSESPSSGSYPFNGAKIVISEFDEANGTLMISSESTQLGKGDLLAFIDKDTSVMVINKTPGKTADITTVAILLPDTSSSSEVANTIQSYWNGNKTRAMSVTWKGALYSIFIHDNHVYFNVTFKNAAGEPVAANVANTSTTLYVYASDNSLIAKFGYDGTVMNQLDGYEDITYTGPNGDLTVDGVATITLDGVEGTYSLNKADGATYTVDAYIDGSYYEVTLDKDASTYSLVKRMVAISYATDYDSANAVSGEVNKNIAITLPVLTYETHIFRGWYIDDETQLINGEYIPTADVTLTAKWDIKVTLTVVYGNGLKNATLEYGAGDTTAPVTPAFTNGKAFNGWYLDDTFETPYTAGAIAADTTIYCNWIDAVAMFGTYYGWNLYSSSSSSSGTTDASSTNYTIDPDGTVKKGTSVIGTVAKVNGDYDYDSTTGIFYVQESETKKTYFVYDAASGALCTGNARATFAFDDYDLDIMFSKFIKDREISALLGAKDVNDNHSGWLMSITFEDDTKVSVFATNTRIYSGVTWTATDASGEVTEYAAKDVGNASTITIKDSSGNVIVSRIKVGSTWKDLDGYQGTYTNGDDSLSLNGGETIVWGSKTGTYVAAPEGSDYNFDVTFKSPDEYYRITISGKTFTAVKPEAVVTFDLGGKGDNFTHNQNLKVKLELRDGSVIPIPTADGFIFKGWYTEAGGEGTRVYDNTFTTTEPVTYYAKWAVLYTVTLVYNDGSADGKEAVEEGTSASLSNYAPKILYRDGKHFAGWYAEPEFTNAVTSLTMDGNKTVYAKWEDGAYVINPQVGNYGFEYDAEKGYYSSTNKGVDSTSATMSVTVYVAGRITLCYQASSEAENKWDYLRILVKGSQKATAGGDNGNEPTTWKTFEMDLDAGDVVEIIYVKDGSAAGGADIGWIKDIVFVEAV